MKTRRDDPDSTLMPRSAVYLQFIHAVKKFWNEKLSSNGYKKPSSSTDADAWNVVESPVRYRTWVSPFSEANGAFQGPRGSTLD
eukprot:494923-Hanusia_phi.AAC.2